MRSILCIEDSVEIQILVTAALNSYQVHHASTLEEAEDWLKTHTFQLILLDLELPDGNGLKFLTRLQTDNDSKNIPVFILTANSDVTNKILAFSVGAEDFITKPFDPLELRARVEAKLRKQDHLFSMADNLKIGDLSISVSKQKIWHVSDQQHAIPTTSLEFKLLLTMARSPERIYSRDQLLDQVWGNETHITDRTVDTHIGHLRKKISDSSVKIETVVGEGYRVIVAPPN